MLGVLPGQSEQREILDYQQVLSQTIVKFAGDALALGLL